MSGSEAGFGFRETRQCHQPHSIFREHVVVRRRRGGKYLKTCFDGSGCVETLRRRRRRKGGEIGAKEKRRMGYFIITFFSQFTHAPKIDAVQYIRACESAQAKKNSGGLFACNVVDGWLRRINGGRACKMAFPV